MAKKIKTEHIVFFIISGILIFAAVSYTANWNINNGKDKPQSEINQKTPLSRDQLNELFLEASDINQFEFDLNDTEKDEIWHYNIKEGDIKVTLPEAKYNGEDIFDTVYLNNVYEVAYSYCSKKTCKEKDLFAEPIDYEEYYVEKPIWIYAKIKNASFAGYEMLGNHNATILDFEEDTGNKGRVWVQTYYKIPLMINYTDFEGHERTIKYENFYWNNQKIIHVGIPSNVTLENYTGISANPSIFIQPLSEFDFELPS